MNPQTQNQPSTALAARTASQRTAMDTPVTGFVEFPLTGDNHEFDLRPALAKLRAVDLATVLTDLSNSGAIKDDELRQALLAKSPDDTLKGFLSDYRHAYDDMSKRLRDHRGNGLEGDEQPTLAIEPAALVGWLRAAHPARLNQALAQHFSTELKFEDREDSAGRKEWLWAVDRAPGNPLAEFLGRECASGLRSVRAAQADAVAALNLDQAWLAQAQAALVAGVAEARHSRPDCLYHASTALANRLLDRAQQAADAGSSTFAAEDFNWVIGAVDVQAMVPRVGGEEAIRRRLAEGLLRPEQSDLSAPIIAVVDPELMEVDLWDGVHRVASAFLRGVKTLPALIGHHREAMNFREYNAAATASPKLAEGPMLEIIERYEQAKRERTGFRDRG